MKTPVPQSYTSLISSAQESRVAPAVDKDRRGVHGPRSWGGGVGKSEIMQGQIHHKIKEYNIVYLKYNSQKNENSLEDIH